jgi:hypothetical protein
MCKKNIHNIWLTCARLFQQYYSGWIFEDRSGVGICTLLERFHITGWLSDEEYDEVQRVMFSFGPVINTKGIAYWWDSNEKRVKFCQRQAAIWLDEPLLDIEEFAIRCYIDDKEELVTANKQYKIGNYQEFKVTNTKLSELLKEQPE